MLKNPWWTVLGAVLGLIVSNGPIVQFAYGVFLKPLTEAFGSDRATMSSAILFAFIATAVGTPVIGRLIDRLGVKRVTLPLVVVFAAAIALLGVLPSSAFTFIALFTVAGLLAAGNTPLPYAKAVAAAFDRQRGLALGISMAGVGLGTAIVPKVAQAMIDSLGWRSAYIGLGCLIVALALPALVVLIRDPVGGGGRPDAAIAAELPGLTGAQALGTWQFWAMLVAFFLLALACSGTFAHIVAMLTDRGVEAATATSTLAAAGIALIIGRVIAGFLLDKIYAPWVALAFIALTLVGLLLLVDVKSPMQASMAAVLVGMGLGAEVDLIAYMITRFLGMRAFGEIYGYQFGGFLLASGFGPFLMGVSHTRTGSYDTAIVAFAIGLAAAAVLMLTMGQYAYAPREARKA